MRSTARDVHAVVHGDNAGFGPPTSKAHTGANRSWTPPRGRPCRGAGRQPRRTDRRRRPGRTIRPDHDHRIGPAALGRGAPKRRATRPARPHPAPWRAALPGRAVARHRRRPAASRRPHRRCTRDPLLHRRWPSRAERPEPQHLRRDQTAARGSRAASGSGRCPTFVSSSRPWPKACSSTPTGRT